MAVMGAVELKYHLLQGTNGGKGRTREKFWSSQMPEFFDVSESLCLKVKTCLNLLVRLCKMSYRNNYLSFITSCFNVLSNHYDISLQVVVCRNSVVFICPKSLSDIIQIFPLKDVDVIIRP